MTENLGRTLGSLPMEGLGAYDLEEMLATFGRRYLDVLMTPTAVSLFRVAVGEGARFPALARVFYESGAGLASSKLAELLTAFEQSGELKAGEAHAVAERFCGALRDDVYLKVVLGLREPPDEEEAEAAVRRTVEIFTAGIRRTRR